MKVALHENAFRLIILLFSVMLASCAIKDGAPERYNRDWRTIEDATPLDEPFSRYGNPGSYEVFGQRYQVMNNNAGFNEKGLASWYGSKFHGRRTSSGETYDMYEMTAAHKSLRIPSYVEVTNLSNNRKAIVKVNDRGPFHEGRIIDLSYAAAIKLGVIGTGTAPVSIRVIEVGKPKIELVNNSPAGVGGSNKINNKPVKFSGDKLIGDHFYVQVAAFANEESALKMLNDLKDKKFRSVRIHVEEKQDKLLYRVRIGPVPTTLVAEKLVVKLKEINHNDVKIVALKTK